jgi:NTE family protein
MEITLALGGGGVKGFAHLGVIRVLERMGYQIRAIAGSSAGGLIGAIYAAGFNPDEIEAQLSKIDQRRLYHRLPGDGPSLLGLGGVVNEIQPILGERDFSNLRLPFACTAVELQSGRLVYLKEGNVLEAVLSTVAVPGVFPPHPWNGRMMVDGGVLDPVPVELARELAPGLPVVAVVLSPTMREWEKSRTPPRLLYSMPMFGKLANLRPVQSLNIFLRSVDIAGCHLTELKLRTEKPEVIIRPDVAHIGLIDRVNISEVSRLGEEAAMAALPQLRQMAGWRYRLSNRLSWLNLFSQTNHVA